MRLSACGIGDFVDSWLRSRTTQIERSSSAKLKRGVPHSKNTVHMKGEVIWKGGENFKRLLKKKKDAFLMLKGRRFIKIEMFMSLRINIQERLM